MIVTQRLETEERRADGKVREKAEESARRGKEVHDHHNWNVLV